MMMSTAAILMWKRNNQESDIDFDLMNRACYNIDADMTIDANRIVFDLPITI